MLLETIGACVVGYWASCGVVRGALQFGQGVMTAGQAIAQGDPTAALALVGGGLVAPLVDVAQTAQKTGEVAFQTGLVIGDRLSASRQAIFSRGRSRNGIPEPSIS